MATPSQAVAPAPAGVAPAATPDANRELPAAAPAPVASSPVVPPAVTPPIVAAADAARPLPDGPVYWCAVGDERTEIVTEPALARLCRRAPEMGPCQFERNACRARGGTVLNGAGIAVTTAIEAEYDRHVMRVTLNSDGAAPKAAARR